MAQDASTGRRKLGGLAPAGGYPRPEHSALDIGVATQQSHTRHLISQAEVWGAHRGDPCPPAAAMSAVASPMSRPTHEPISSIGTNRPDAWEKTSPKTGDPRSPGHPAVPDTVQGEGRGGSQGGPVPAGGRDVDRGEAHEAPDARADQQHRHEQAKCMGEDIA